MTEADTGKRWVTRWPAAVFYGLIGAPDKDPGAGRNGTEAPSARHHLSTP